jgi:2-polyprenyl-3-methyl-5-hydroxy-6-metoxy-1,4-benzoquinol methylase
MANWYETEIEFGTRSSHTLILDFVGHNKRVLDVGTSTGYLAEALAKRGCTVIGIELDPEAARQAEEHCERVVVGDVETLGVHEELGRERFDVIVFGDVLEHLRDPLRTLERLKPLLLPEGYVVASIPNVAHGSVRLALLQGRFQYRPLGLLDNTHLRFFTRETAEQLFSDAGFEVGKLERTTLDVFGPFPPNTEVEVDQEKIPNQVLELVRADPEAFTYQFVLTAYPSGKTAAKQADSVPLSLEQPDRSTAMLQKAKRKRREREKRRRQLDDLREQLAEKDRIIFLLNRRLRSLETLKYLLENRTEQLARKEQRISELAQEIAECNRLWSS